MPEDYNLQSHFCENFRFQKLYT